MNTAPARGVASYVALIREFDPMCNLLNPKQLCIALQSVCINREPLVRFVFCFLILCTMSLSLASLLSHFRRLVCMFLDAIVRALI